MSIGNNSSCHWGSGLCVLDEPAASYLSSAKVPIDWSTDCASVSPPVQPFPRPLPLASFPYPPSIPPPTPAQGLIDQPCPCSCPQITQLDVFCVWVKWINYRANRTGDRGARKSPWMQQRAGKEERRRAADMKQMAERREWGWFGGNKRDVFRRIFSGLWRQKGSPCPCEHLSVSEDGSSWQNTTANAARVQGEVKLKKLWTLSQTTGLTAENVEKLLLESWKAPYKAGLCIWGKTKQSFCRRYMHWWNKEITTDD